MTIWRMFRAAVVMMMLVAGCSSANLHRVNRAGLAIAEGAITCDWIETRGAAARGWERVHEDNPIMGSNPSAGVVDVYMLGAAVAVASAWSILPERYRFLAWAPAIASQIYALADNANHHLPLCGAF
jgi:hypothetical protein